MKIIGIVGILDFPGSQDRLWKHVREAFREKFPDAEFVAEHELYLPWQRAKIKAFEERILERHDCGEDLILFGYSLGGVIALSLAERFAKSRVILIATLGAPLRLARARVPQIPVITFSGVLDPVVPWFLTALPGSMHVNLISDHLFWLIVSKKPARLIAENIHRALTQTTQVPFACGANFVCGRRESNPL